MPGRMPRMRGPDSHNRGITLPSRSRDDDRDDGGFHLDFLFPLAVDSRPTISLTVSNDIASPASARLTASRFAISGVDGAASRKSPLTGVLLKSRKFRGPTMPRQASCARLLSRKWRSSTRTARRHESSKAGLRASSRSARHDDGVEVEDKPMTIFLLLIGAWIYGGMTFLAGLWWASRGKTQR
jgi:hypothetical protein